VANDPKLVNSYLALEKLALPLMTDEQRVQWFQQRAQSAEEANAELELQLRTGEIIKEFPLVDADDIKGLKTEAEIKTVAARIQAKAEKAKASGVSEVEEAIKEVLKVKDTEIADMRKVYGKARQPQAGDVTGSNAATVAAAAAAGIGPDATKDDGTIEGSVKRQMGNLFERLGIGGS
jgi:hypothetical protein